MSCILPRHRRYWEEIKTLFSIKGDQAENTEIKKRIDESSSISGTNLWILIMAIFVASIGLNMNSTAVIIGAMLISPLMGGIISIGYGFAIDDVNHIKRAATNFGIQVGISILVSTVYFFCTPLTEVTSELLARVEPTIWDVLIAIFAGAAGLIALTRKDRISNVVPGTAIATALMPPLCTVGFGIATRNLNFVLGAAYLFFINSFFICFVSAVGFRFMHVVSPNQEKAKPKKHVVMWIVVIIAILPSIYLAWNIVDETITQSNYREFINDQFDFEKTQVFDDKLDINNKKIEVVLIGDEISQNDINRIDKNKKIYELADYKLEVNQMPVSDGITESQIKDMIDGKKTFDINGQKIIIEGAKTEEQRYDEMEKELMILYPEIDEVGIAKMMDKDGKEKNIVLIESEEGISFEKRQIIQAWIKEKTGNEMEIVTAIEPLVKIDVEEKEAE